MYIHVYLYQSQYHAYFSSGPPQLDASDLPRSAHRQLVPLSGNWHASKILRIVKCRAVACAFDSPRNFVLDEPPSVFHLAS